MTQYLDATREDELLHRSVVRAVYGLVEHLQSERKGVPGEVLLDPHFDGDEPLGLLFDLSGPIQSFGNRGWVLNSSPFVERISGLASRPGP
jgi:hypothetical protein